MACVWQNSWRAKQYNQYQNTAYSQYANVPEIFISVSSNNGQDWSEPMVINSVQIQQFNNIKPMWVYPADIIKNTGTIVNGHPVGKLALMFYDDISWGAYSIDSPQGTNSGGYVKYMTINIEMPAGSTSGITGYVRRADNQQPIANATVACGDQTTLTNAQGMYTLNVLPGLCTVNAVAPGYIPTTANVTVTEGNFTNHNFNLTAYPLVSVYGVVQGGNPAQPLTNATVTLTGVQNYSAVTNTVGEFNIPNVISNYSYDYTISKPGYWNALGSIVVISSNHNMGTIQLVEILASPLNVLATELPGNQQVHLQWVAPVPSRWSSDSAQKPMFTNERTDRSLTGYTIWRMLEGQELNQAVWVLIGSCNAGSTTITDTNWGALNEGNYRYAVRANYGNDSSEPTFSNILHRYLYGTLTGYVRDLDDLPVCNALVSLYRVVPDGNGPYFGNTNSLGQYSIPGIMYGLYALSFEALCYCPVDNLEITIFQNLVTTYDVVLQDLLIPPCIATAEVNTQNTLVLVHWEMPELDNNRSLTGFRIWRFCGDNDDNPDAWTFLAETIVTFNYIDLGWSALPAGIYKYAIRAIYSGNHQSEAALSNPVEKTTGLSPENAVAGIDYLYGASPNPFRGKTSITYSLMQNQPVNIEIYSITGQLISKISKSDSKSGLNTLSWNACDKAGKPLPSGVYICRMITNGTTYSRKLILLR
ncbi:MAG: carboxypeptidase regulatory-like domain-containing protein [Candidatus Cloacimonetes bacterium]|nr:carboxypeptidase regulatory-like domain-containing protein [Candidatus Cloacimonadota bacterium]